MGGGRRAAVRPAPGAQLCSAQRHWQGCLHGTSSSVLGDCRRASTPLSRQAGWPSAGRLRERRQAGSMKQRQQGGGATGEHVWPGLGGAVHQRAEGRERVHRGLARSSRVCTAAKHGRRGAARQGEGGLKGFVTPYSRGGCKQRGWWRGEGSRQSAARRRGGGGCPPRRPGGAATTAGGAAAAARSAARRQAWAARYAQTASRLMRA